MKEKLDRVNRYTSVNSVCLKVSEVWVCLHKEGGSLQGVLLAGLDQYEGSAGQRVELLNLVLSIGILSSSRGFAGWTRSTRRYSCS